MDQTVYYHIILIIFKHNVYQQAYIAIQLQDFVQNVSQYAKKKMSTAKQVVFMVTLKTNNLAGEKKHTQNKQLGWEKYTQKITKRR